ncbi:class E sortase [Streptomyces sp. NPDC093089]|uniref:class E sortase n=1 Tax=Streptomyces sp. NPDC093089 TaxID=3366024 RepID=UPI0037FD82B7
MTTGSPWFRASDAPEPEPIPADPYGYGQPAPYEPQPQPHPSAYEPQPQPSAYEAHPQPSAYESQPSAYEQAYAPEPVTPYAPQPATPYEPAHEVPHEAPREPRAGYGDGYEAEAGYEAPRAPVDEPYAAEEPAEPPRARRDETMPLRAVEPLPGPGRAERRRAAAKGGRGRSRGAAPAAAEAPAEARPLSRVEARRAARAAKESVGVVASRVVGELFITLGVVMLLFVTYQLWWTNVLAGQETDRAKAQIEDTWAKGDADKKKDDDKPGAFEAGEGFAIMYIPKLDVVAPIAEGIDKAKVLDKGMVGHYGEGKLKTAMPGDEQGNFAVAGHRNTHGEPFRYINRLNPGDPIVVETRDAYYTYEMASILPQTSPSNISVIEPVPKGSGFTEPGRYITLTTCTPEFTSTYRMIVWGKLVEERPRSKGKPEALVG